MNSKKVRSGSSDEAGRKVRLRPANPFDLIRLIAHSQSDARKAVAELVQNSLDADAHNVVVSRQRRRGEVILSVLDDGRGVFPELDRPNALQKIATNIGHSFKRNLPLAERQRQMMLGQYGIGILGFWCVGRELEMRTQVDGSELWQLRLVRDQPMAEVRPARQHRMAFDTETWTEVVIRDVHAAPARQLSGRRLGEYLGAELRGQLLARNVRLRIVDRMARNPALKEFLVVPQRFHGRRLSELAELSVPGHPAATLELYLANPDGEQHAKIALSCVGAVVWDEFGTIQGYGLDAELWSAGHLEGVVDFPALDVAPGTRRGFSPSHATDALFEALRGLEPRLRELLDQERARHREAEDVNLAREIRNVFRPLVRSLPQYDFFEIILRGRDGNGDARKGPAYLGSAASPIASGVPSGDVPSSEAAEAQDEAEPQARLFAPCALHSVRIVPSKCRLLPGATRSLRAKSLDEAGHQITESVEFTWEIIEGDGSLIADGYKATLTAGHSLGLMRVRAAARQGERHCYADAEIEVVEKLAGENPDAGIPDPKRAFDPTGDWRSRVVDGHWEYNSAHPDYRAVADDPKQRLRYLVHLFAKEIVLHNYGEPKDDRVLERMVQVLTHIKPRF